VLSHAAAGALWRIRASAATLIDVTAPGQRGRRRAGLRVHRAQTLHPSEVTTVDGIPVTTLARTVVDLAGVLHREAAEYAIHQAERIHGLDLSEVSAVVDRSPTRPGTRLVRRALHLSLPEERRANSPLARRFFRICRRAGLPLPEIDFWIDLPHGHGVEVDFAWPGLRIAVETDGRESHATHRAFENDRARDRRLTLAGWRVLRFTWRDVIERPDDVERQLWALLAVAA
jgi:very-short-patch-repair endonuclease